MSVFTPLNDAELAQAMDEYGLIVEQYEAAHHGIENSNFFVDAHAADGQSHGYVFTLFEQIPFDALPWFFHLLERAGAHLPVPVPVQKKDGHRIGRVKDKPAALMPKLRGEHIHHPNEDHCAQIGAALAQLHLLPMEGLECGGHDEAARIKGLHRWVSSLPEDLQQQADKTLQNWNVFSTENMADFRLIHGDLFRDNVLFKDNRLSGLLDFYNAGNYHPLYDVAVAINDWCSNAEGRLDQDHAIALLDGYRAFRPLNIDALFLALQIAALRFVLSRLESNHLVEEDAQGAGTKDPEEFLRIYRNRLEEKKWVRLD
jgi:homoserine kinase type II